MSESSTETAILKILDWAYGTATQGVLGFDSANDLAEDYLKGDGTLSEKVNSLIQWQYKKAGTAGFLAGLGGLIALPVMVPANISVVLLVQVRMIAAIAIMGGHDVKDDRVRTLVYLCLAGKRRQGDSEQDGRRPCHQTRAWRDTEHSQQDIDRHQ